ncbi:MAG TPA: hypothetical protein VFH71_13580 [Rhodanobacteraceae bacterium]|nr:hypothetical protein [Rhodanobacteraceae bacterium]
MRFERRTLTFIVLAAAVLLTALVYWPGVYGGFVFDDFPNIVDNLGVHVTHSTLAAWANAAWSSPSSSFHRPLASLTFAANWFFSGSNPFAMKVTNICIHLLNGLLVYAMVRELLRAWRARRGEQVIEDAAAHRLSLAVAAAWMLLPINLMAVLYVVQRMESLCQVFVLAGLWAYLRGRRRMFAAVDTRDEHIGLIQALLGIVLGTGIGLLSKESAVLMPVYAFLVECTLLGFASRSKQRDWRMLALYVFVLLLPAAIGLAWLLPGILRPAAWDGRSFTLGERLLTEARVLVKYLRWTLFPDPVSLSLYHDEMPLSTGLFRPWTTFPAILFLAALFGIAVWLRKRRPLVSLGILWFFAAQLLTATIIPLELVYEHRNYFASIGVLLAVFSILLGLRRVIVVPIVRGALVAVFLMWCAGVTYLRAQDWSNPLGLALSEANRHPDSPRANYEAGRLLIIASDYEPGPALEKAEFYLRRAGAIPGASTLPEQARIMIATHEGKANDTAVWNQMITKLRDQPTSQEDISALISLTQCRVKGDCHFDIAPLQRAFLAALSRPNPIARLYAAYADFARDLLHDNTLAIRNLEIAVRKAPDTPAYRVEVAHLQAISGLPEQAMRNVQVLEQMNSLGRLNADIATLKKQIEFGRGTAAATPNH